MPDSTEEVNEPREAGATPKGARALVPEAAADRTAPGPLAFLNDVALDLRVNVGQAHLTIREILNLRRGSIIPLDKLSGEPVDITVGNERLAEGEVIVIQDKLRIRIVDIVYPPSQNRPETDPLA